MREPQNQIFVCSSKQSGKSGVEFPSRVSPIQDYSPTLKKVLIRKHSFGKSSVIGVSTCAYDFDRRIDVENMIGNDFERVKKKNKTVDIYFLLISYFLRIGRLYWKFRRTNFMNFKFLTIYN